MSAEPRRLRELSAARRILIRTFHISADPGGLRCPVCLHWSPLMFRPSGARIECRCGAVTIMPLASLARSIERLGGPEGAERLRFAQSGVHRAHRVEP